MKRMLPTLKLTRDTTVRGECSSCVRWKGFLCKCVWALDFVAATWIGHSRDVDVLSRRSNSWMALLLDILDVGSLCVFSMGQTPPSCCLTKFLPCNKILTRLATGVVSRHCAVLPNFDAVSLKCCCWNRKKRRWNWLLLQYGKPSTAHFAKTHQWTNNPWAIPSSDDTIIRLHNYTNDIPS